MAYSFFSNFAVALVAASFIPLIYSHPTNQRPGGPWSVLHERDEVNPVAPKFMTKPDPDMPPLVDFSVMSKYNLSSWDDEALALTSKIFLPGQFQARVPIANGYIGAAVSAAGPFFEKDVNQTNHPRPGSDVTEGWPLFGSRQTFSSVSGFYDCQATTPGVNYPELQEYGCESVISGTPYPLSIHLVVGDQILNPTVNPATVRSYKQVLRFRDGLTQWSYTWSPSSSNLSFDISFDSFMSRVRPTVAATQLRVTPQGGNCTARIVDLLNGQSAKRSFLGQKGISNNTPSIYVSNHPDGLPNVEAWTVSTANVSNGYTIETSRQIAKLTGCNSSMTIGQQWDVQLIDGETTIFQKFVGIASTDKFQNPSFVASSASKQAMEDGWDKVLSEHTHAWNQLMQRSRMTSYRDPETGKLPINDSTIEKFQIAAVADRYFIIQNLLPENGSNLNDNGIGVSGLSSDDYGGMLFWDQELWMYPPIAISEPQYARQILKSRLKHFAQAKANAQMPYVQERYKFNNKSALYPWTSGRFGNATATGPVLNYEYHLNTDIAISMFQYLAITGDEAYFKNELWPVVESIGHSIATLLVKDGDKWSIRNMTDPDEYANHVNNGAFTLASMSQVMQDIIKFQKLHDMEVNETWVDMANNVNLPRAASGITEEFEAMQDNVTVKQADVSLLVYPLAWRKNYTLDDKIRDLAYYSQKQTPDGPAMTYAIAAISENLVSSTGCAAFIYDLQARFSNYRGPWYQMSEQANDDKNANGGIPPAFPFLTGHGGASQIPHFGYLGLDLTHTNLTIQPSLPHPFKHLQIGEFHFGGATLRASMNSTHTNVTRIQSSTAKGLVDKYYPGPMPLVVGSAYGRIHEHFYTLMINQTITVENDMYWEKATTPNNLVQCQTAFSRTEDMPGQYPGAATDGNAGTRWQPLTRDAARLAVDMSTVPYQQVKQINLDWGRRPPDTAWVGFTNCSRIDSLDDSRICQIQKINISLDQCYPENTGGLEVVPYVGNRTEHILPNDTSVWTGRYTLLEIQGCRDCGLVRVGTSHGTVFEEDGMGATVGEFEVIGTLGTDILQGMEAETADERMGE